MPVFFQVLPPPSNRGGAGSEKKLVSTLDMGFPLCYNRRSGGRKAHAFCGILPMMPLTFLHFYLSRKIVGAILRQ